MSDQDVPGGVETPATDDLGDKPTADGDAASVDDSDSIAHGSHTHAAGATALTLGALGVVFGDIGTSPLYAIRESFEHQHLAASRVNALGVASLAFWALIVIICVKYLALVMRADNNGEGGILALTALIMPKKPDRRRSAARLVMLGVFGTCLLYGDGLITPAISVLSAVEGFEVASSAFDRYVIPLACLILFCLFLVQRRGTGGIGRVFGPVMVVWFTVLGVLGMRQILAHPDVINAIHPIHIVSFFAEDPRKAFLALGSIFLVVTGGEALYADMGHFGRRPITIAWYGLVLPGLVLNYFGQAALVLDTKEVGALFYRMAPQWGVTPLAILATMASVIASQALISGAFSLTVQAVQLDYLPRVAIRHTSGEHQGQVYVPLVNWALMVGSIGLVVGFGSTSHLAAAYGIAVTSTMVITTILFAVLARGRWGWSRRKVLVVTLPLLIIDTAFFAANVPKIPHGGWFPLLVALVLLVQMATWRRGRDLVAQRIQRGERPIEEVLEETSGVSRVAGTAVFLFKDLGKAPPALVNNLRHNKVLHHSTLIVSVETADVPRLQGSNRAEVTKVSRGVFQVLL
ncbi:MAG: system potassium uptake protein, partial [Ilumatobacteraceae bacterium]